MTHLQNFQYFSFTLSKPRTANHSHSNEKKPFSIQINLSNLHTARISLRAAEWPFVSSEHACLKNIPRDPSRPKAISSIMNASERMT